MASCSYLKFVPIDRLPAHTIVVGEVAALQKHYDVDNPPKLSVSFGRLGLCSHAIQSASDTGSSKILHDS